MDEQNYEVETLETETNNNGTLLGIGIGVVGTVLAGLAGKYVIKPLAGKVKTAIADGKAKKAAKKAEKDNE